MKTPTIKPRNPIIAHLMKRGYSIHTTSNKSKRNKDKIKLLKQVNDEGWNG